MDSRFCIFFWLLLGILVADSEAFTSPGFTSDTSPSFTSPDSSSPSFTSPSFTSPSFTSPSFTSPSFTIPGFTFPSFTIAGLPTFPALLPSFQLGSVGSMFLVWDNTPQVAPWNGRCAFGAAGARFNGSTSSFLWILGGYSGPQQSYNYDIWITPINNRYSLSWKTYLAQASARGNLTAVWRQMDGGLSEQILEVSGVSNNAIVGDSVGFNSSNVPFVSSILYQSNFTLSNGATGMRPRANGGTVSVGTLIYVMGGINASQSYLNDVWQYPDVLMTTNAPWAARSDFCLETVTVTSTVPPGTYMVLFGGKNQGTVFADAWWSADGANWSQLPGGLPWGKRYGMSVFGLSKAAPYTRDGVSPLKGLVVAGGADDTEKLYNDVWFSDDPSIGWRMLTNASPWPARKNFELHIQGQQIYAMGGFSVLRNASSNVTINSYNNDVWTGYISFNPLPPSSACVVLVVDPNNAFTSPNEDAFLTQLAVQLSTQKELLGIMDLTDDVVARLSDAFKALGSYVQQQKQQHPNGGFKICFVAWPAPQLFSMMLSTSTTPQGTTQFRSSDTSPSFTSPSFSDPSLTSPTLSQSFPGSGVSTNYNQLLTGLRSSSVQQTMGKNVYMSQIVQVNVDGGSAVLGDATFLDPFVDGAISVDTARSVSAATTVVVATVVGAGIVASVVASSVVTGNLWTLIRQVQFTAITGTFKTGLATSYREFANGLKWINFHFDIPVNIGDCLAQGPPELGSPKKFVWNVMVCAFVFIGVVGLHLLILRGAERLCARKLKSGKVPPALNKVLMFPKWEVATIRAQYVGLCQTIGFALGAGCRSYLALGLLSLLIIPIPLIIVAAKMVNNHLDRSSSWMRVLLPCLPRKDVAQYAEDEFGGEEEGGEGGGEAGKEKNAGAGVNIGGAGEEAGGPGTTAPPKQRIVFKGRSIRKSLVALRAARGSSFFGTVASKALALRTLLTAVKKGGDWELEIEGLDDEESRWFRQYGQLFEDYSDDGGYYYIVFELFKNILMGLMVGIATGSAQLWLLMFLYGFEFFFLIFRQPFNDRIEGTKAIFVAGQQFFNIMIPLLLSYALLSPQFAQVWMMATNLIAIVVAMYSNLINQIVLFFSGFQKFFGWAFKALSATKAAAEQVKDVAEEAKDVVMEAKDTVVDAVEGLIPDNMLESLEKVMGDISVVFGPEVQLVVLDAVAQELERYAAMRCVAMASKKQFRFTLERQDVEDDVKEQVDEKLGDELPPVVEEKTMNPFLRKTAVKLGRALGAKAAAKAVGGLCDKLMTTQQKMIEAEENGEDVEELAQSILDSGELSVGDEVKEIKLDDSEVGDMVKENHDAEAAAMMTAVAGVAVAAVAVAETKNGNTNKKSDSKIGKDDKDIEMVPLVGQPTPRSAWEENNNNKTENNDKNNDNNNNSSKNKDKQPEPVAAPAILGKKTEEQEDEGEKAHLINNNKNKDDAVAPIRISQAPVPAASQATVTLVLDMNINEISENSPERSEFVTSFEAEVSRALGIDSWAVSVVGLAAGSVLATIKITTMGDAAALAAELIRQSQDPFSYLRTKGRYGSLVSGGRKQDDDALDGNSDLQKEKPVVAASSLQSINRLFSVRNGAEATVSGPVPKLIQVHDHADPNHKHEDGAEYCYC